MKISLLTTLGLLVISMSCRAQIGRPVKWSYAAKKINTTEAMVFFKATI